MYLFVTDETNTQPSNGVKFFIYGGLIFSSVQAQSVNGDIENIRKRYGFESGDELKFNTRSKPDHMSRGDHEGAKNDVIESCAKAGVKFVAYLILHDIATDSKQKDEYALNTVLSVFDSNFLVKENAVGVVVIDRLPNEAVAYKMLQQKFQVGLSTQAGEPLARLDRVVLYATTCNGASHLSSAVDITLGAFRYVVNSLYRPQSSEVPRILFTKLVDMIYGRHPKLKFGLNGNGLLLRPLNPRIPAYRAEYQRLTEYLDDLLTPRAPDEH